MASFFDSLDLSTDLCNGVFSLKYDSKLHLLRELFFESFGLPAHCTESDFEKFLTTCDLNSTIELGHDVLRSSDFRAIWTLMLADLAKIYGPIAHQANPTFRIQKVGTRSVPFHTDEITSGHPDQIINVWIPFVSLNRNNTLHFIASESTAQIKLELLQYKRSIEWISKTARPISSPWLGKYGDVVLFSNQTLHGTIVNNSTPRASIDFRILPEYKNAKMNAKKMNFDYLPFTGSLDTVSKNSPVSYKLNAISLIFSNADAKHLSHSLQRSIINEFAAKNSILIVKETAEWQTPHYPMIEEILDHSPEMSILLATANSYINCKEYTSEFLRLLPKINSHPSPVWFCFENKCINP